MNMKIKQNISLKRYTTLGIGGPAEYFCCVKTLSELKQAFMFAKQNVLPVTVMGGGSNVLIADAGVQGLVICVAHDTCVISGNRIVVGAGMSLDKLVEMSVKKNLRGLENLSGIPGTIGGAIYGNARAFGGSIGDMVRQVVFFDCNGVKKSFSQDACGFSYGTSVFKQKQGGMPGVIWQVELFLDVGSNMPWEKMNLRQAIIAYRNVRYPPKNKSAGCFFGNAAAGMFSPNFLSKLPRFAKSQKEIGAGYLLEQAGVAGKKIGGAQIMRHQANYFVNAGSATALDVIKLAQFAQKKVFERFGVRLQHEVRLMGFDRDPFAESCPQVSGA